MDNPYPIYPSQTDTLKHRGKEFAQHISKETNTKIISCFKRNDWLSQALGYKGHTDLLKSTEFRKQADQNQPLELFSDNTLRLKIVDVFSQRTNISNEVLSLCSKKVAEHEVILNNVNPKASLPMAMYMDEMTFHETPQMTEIRECINSTSTPKLGIPRLVVDLSELPTNVYQALCAHPAYRGFHFDETRTDVEIIRKQPSSLKATDDWKIRASFDIWAEADIPMDVLNDWVVFKEWLLLFNAAGRVHVWDRLKGRTKLQYELQVSPVFKVTDLYEKMTNEHDTNLLHVLLNPEKKLTDELVYFDPKSTLPVQYTNELVKALTGLMTEEKHYTFAKVEFEYRALDHSGVLISEARVEESEARTELAWLRYFEISESLTVGLTHNLQANKIKDQVSLTLKGMTFDPSSELGKKPCGITPNQPPHLIFGHTRTR